LFDGALWDSERIGRGYRGVVPLAGNGSAPKYLIFDRATNSNQEVVGTIKTLGTEPKRTSFQSPWQNGVRRPFAAISQFLHYPHTLWDALSPTRKVRPELPSDTRFLLEFCPDDILARHNLPKQALLREYVTKVM
jgi:hypothetical protein